MEMEKISNSQPATPNADHGDEVAVRDPSVQTGGFRSPGSGARLFVW